MHVPKFVKRKREGKEGVWLLEKKGDKKRKENWFSFFDRSRERPVMLSGFKVKVDRNYLLTEER